MNNIHWICSGLNDADQPLISLFQGPFCHFSELSTYFFQNQLFRKMWNNISVHLDCLVIGLHVCGIGRYFQIWWKIKNGIIFLELRFWYGTLEFFQLPFPLTPNTILRVHQSRTDKDVRHKSTSDINSNMRFSSDSDSDELLKTRVRQTLFCTLLI